MASLVLHAGPDDREWRAQLVGGIRRELPLALERRAPIGQRLPDGHQRATGVEGTHDDRPHERQQATADKHDRQRLERSLLCGTVLEHLDHVWLARAHPALGQDPPGRSRDGPLLVVPAVRERARDGGLIRGHGRCEVGGLEDARIKAFAGKGQEGVGAGAVPSS